MEIFSLTLQQMLMMFTLILAGYLLRRCKILPETSDTTLARLETYIFCPALSLFSQISQCRIENFIENSKIIIFGAVITFAMMIIAVPVSKLFVRNSKTSKDEYQRNVYKYSIAIANFAFMGNFLIRGVWGEEMLYKYVLFTFTLLLVCSSWGLYILI
ncbi:MAG: AEC family transporter, partial [Oscillospiraceae bacterium]|nr:AEC family transporter [Oscillospiraceae bacterium]